MKLTDIQQAKAEALRFIKRCNQLEQLKPSDFDVQCGSMYTGYIRRASLDLTRTLAQMRKPG